MKDYTYHDENGRTMPVRKMPRAAINEMLSLGRVCIIAEECERSETEACVLDRLRIELVIRSLMGEQH